MSARIDIVNNALVWLGVNQITSLEDDSQEAKVMKTSYYLARDATLEAHDWSFAITEFTPARNAENEAWAGNYSFNLPSDIIRLVGVWRAYSGGPLHAELTEVHSIYRRPQADYVLESGVIITNEQAIQCKGIRRIEDEGIYSSQFAHAFAAKLAMLTAYTLTESDGKFNAMSALYMQMIREATSRDGLQGSNKRIRNRSVRNVR